MSLSSSVRKRWLRADKRTVSWDEVFALWPRINLDWDLLRCVPGFFRPDAGDPVTEDRLRRSGVRQEREEREKEDQVRHPLNRATAKQKKFIPEERKSFILYFSCFLKDISVFSFVCIFAIGCWNEEGRVARKRMMIFHFAWRRRNKSTSTFHLVSLCLNFYWIQIFYLIPVVAPKKRNKPIFSRNQNRPVGSSK